MVRKLKYHEQKLLKKVDFYKQQNEHRNDVIRRYMIQKPSQYDTYNTICGVSLASDTLIRQSALSVHGNADQVVSSPFAN
jgi:hypothetical protein